MRFSILAFVGGIVLLQMQPELPSVPNLLALAALALLLGALFRGRKIALPARLLTLLCCALLGGSWAAWRAEQRLADFLPEAWEVRDIELSGVVASLPQRFEQGERFVFAVEAVHTPEAIVPRNITLAWYRERAKTDLAEDSDAAQNERDEVSARTVHPGERWKFTVRLKRPHGSANAHGFDYEAWSLERSIRATGTVRARAETIRLTDFVWNPAYGVERLRDIIRQRFLDTLPDAPYLGVLIALAIGDQRAIPNAQWQVFNRTGITHLVSISGLHVTMVAALFAALVNALWRRSERLLLRLPAQKASVLAAWLAAFAYALLAGFEVPAQRTLYMLSVVALALWSGRHLSASRILLLALFVVLLLDPWAVLVAGFWLSFGAVSLLFFVGTSRLAEYSERRGKYAWRTVLTQWGATQWAITLGSLPLLLFFFQQFPLTSPLANALAIPLVSFVITPLALFFALLPWSPVLLLDHWLLAQMMKVLDVLAAWPVWQQAAPPWWVLCVACLGTLCCLLPRGFPARYLGVCLLLPALFWTPPRPASGEAWVDVLDVGQGLAIVVRTAEHNLLFDTGPAYRSESNAGQRLVLPYLRAVGIRRLDALIVSHRDKDHSGGAAAILAELPVGRIVSSMPEFGGEACAAGQNWQWDGVRFTVLHPQASDYAQPKKSTNNLSCVLRVSASQYSALLTADIEAANEKAMLARHKGALKSDVLLVPHHGGRGSSTPEFIAATDARAAIFSAGYRNPFKHPRPEVLERYAGRAAWRTDRDGAIHVVLGEQLDISGWRQEKARYWQGR